MCKSKVNEKWNVGQQWIISSSAVKTRWTCAWRGGILELNDHRKEGPPAAFGGALSLPESRPDRAPLAKQNTGVGRCCSWWRGVSTTSSSLWFFSCGHSRSISTVAIILRSVRFSLFQAGEAACQQFLFIDRNSPPPPAPLIPKVQWRFCPAYPSSWLASVLSHTCLSPSLPQLVFSIFLYFATSASSTPPLIPLRFL